MTRVIHPQRYSPYRRAVGLKRYRQKRNFTRTAEPVGGRGTRSAERIFVVQKHAARRLHYDLRLQFAGVLLSWAVPKGPSMRAGQKRLAVKVEDHPLKYAEFQGRIPAGEYGAGTVAIWDRGTWSNRSPQGIRAALRDGRLEFELHGRRLRGEWLLVKTGDGRGAAENWLLIKRRDQYAQPDAAREIVDAKPWALRSTQ